MTGNTIPFEKIDPGGLWVMNVRLACDPRPAVRSRAFRRYLAVVPPCARAAQRPNIDDLPDWMCYNAFVIVKTPEPGPGYARFIAQSIRSPGKAWVMLQTSTPVVDDLRRVTYASMPYLADINHIDPPSSNLTPPPPIEDCQAIVIGGSHKRRYVKWREWARQHP